jgi:hypothetical protein
MDNTSNELRLLDLQEGRVVQLPQRREPAKKEWWDLNSSVNLSTFGYAANFDSNVSFVLPFYIDRNVKKILEIGLTLTFQKFRLDSTPTAHTHDVTIPSHTHSVTIADHTHGVTVSNHTHDVTLGDHTHDIQITLGNSTTGTAVFYAAASPPLSTSGGGTITGQYTSGGGGGTTVTSASGGGQSVTSAAGGAQTVSSAAGGGTTVTSASVSGSELGIVEYTYPANVTVKLDGVDITANLGGNFDPDDTTNVYENLDLTPFITEGGLHTLEFLTTENGRCLPLLWIKSIISR